MIERIISHYRIVEKLGEGGMGVVYKAEDTQLGRFVALKSLPAAHLADENRRARFLREARAASALNHPNIITIYDLIHEGNEDFLVMEFVDGKTLEQTIHGRALPLGEALRIAVPVADALAAAHHAGITHRDLKPGNIMVAKSGVVKLLDFGLAKLKEKPAISSDDSTQTAAQHTEEGAIMGTISFMSPEQAQGKPVDGRSDIFSFGAVLYEMITGRRAFLGDNKMSTLAAVLEKEPKPASEIIPNLPREVDRLILRCLRKDPAKRWQTMADLKVALEELKDESDSNRLSGPATAISASSKRPPALWAGLGVLAISAAAGAWWTLRAPAPESAPARKVDLTTYPGAEEQPHLSPDGSQVVFVWDGGEGRQFDVYVKLVDTGEPLRLTNTPESESNPKWSPDGRQIAFKRGRSIYVIPPLGGTERKVLEGASPALSGFNFDWSRDGKSMVVSDENRLCLIELATGQRKWITQARPQGNDLSPSFSPDGSQVAFVRARTAAGQQDILAVPVDGGEPRAVYAEQGFNQSPIWIAGGQEILFNPQWSALFRVPASGGKAVRVTESDDSVRGPTYSHASRRLVYSKIIEDMNVWGADFSKGGKAERIIASTRRDFSAQPSPDGQRLVFTSDRTGSWEIWTSAIDGSQQSQLTSFGPGSIADGARFSPDGKTIVFAALLGGNRDIYTIGADGGSPKRLTQEPSDEGRPWYSNDGKSIYFRSNRSGREEIWLMPSAGGPARQITKGGGFEVRESPDGSAIYFTKGRGVPGLWKSLPDGAGAEPVQGLEGVSSALWTVSAAGIYFIERRTQDTWALQRWSPQKRAAEPVLSIGAPIWPTAPALSCTPDGKRVVWHQSDQSGADLVLIENFR